MSYGDISMYTEVGEHKVREIITCFQQTDKVNVLKHLKPQLYCALCDYDIQVSITSYN